MAENAEALSESVSNEDRSIDQLRDILFGQQTRDFDKRLQELEQKMTELHQQVLSKIDHKIDSLRTELLQSEESLRSQAIEELSDRVNSAFERLSIESSNQQTAVTAEFSELRQTLDTGEHELRTAFEKAVQQLEIRMDDHLAALDNDKINKSTLSEMLLTLVEGIKKG